VLALDGVDRAVDGADAVGAALRLAQLLVG
jgi:hypothetical protein